jgi:hypothetical protein
LRNLILSLGKAFVEWTDEALLARINELAEEAGYVPMKTIDAQPAGCAVENGQGAPSLVPVAG